MENASFVIFAGSNDGAAASTSTTPAGANATPQTTTTTQTTTAPANGRPQQQQDSGLFMMLPFVILIVVMIAISVRTNSKEKKKREEMMNSIRKGTKVMTSGGILGEIAEVQKDAFLLKVANNVQIAISRTAIAQVIQPSAAEPAADDTKTEVKKK